MRRAFGHALLSVGAIAIVLLVLVGVDERVRQQIELRFSDSPTAELSQASQQVRDLTTVVVEAIHDQSIEHAPLLIFVLGASVLFLLMLRT